MISKILLQMNVKTIVAAVFLMTATTAFAQSPQTKVETVNPQKQTDVKSSDQLNDNKIEQNLREPANDLVAAQSETVKLPTDIGSQFTGRGKMTASKNPFANYSAAKPNSSAGQTSSADDWQFSFAPYLYATGISGTVGARGRVVEIDASFGKVLENLDIGLMGTFEAKKGKLIFVSDLIWTKMSAERDTPGGLYSDAKLGVNLFIFDPEVGYRVIEKTAGSLDLLGGVRIWSVENNLNLRTGILPGFDVSERKTFAAPVIGVRGLLNLSPKFFLNSKFDIGGGIGADLTTQFYGGAGYRIKPNIALLGGYRFLQVDYDDSEGFLFDTKMNGFVFGAKFSF